MDPKYSDNFCSHNYPKIINNIILLMRIFNLVGSVQTLVLTAMILQSQIFKNMGNTDFQKPKTNPYFGAVLQRQMKSLL